MQALEYNACMAKSKNKTVYVCRECGHTYTREVFRCASCNGYDIDKTTYGTGSTAGLKASVTPEYEPKSPVHTIDELDTDDVESKMSTGVDELDRVLDGGVSPGQVILIGAEPGFGKSTLCLEVLSHFAGMGTYALYASGEESARQIAQRAKRLGIHSDNIGLLSTSSVEDVVAHADRTKAGIICVDSLQAMASENVSSGLGSITQSKEASFFFRDYAKRHEVPMLLISQFNKSDEVAGSNQIPHAVDTILVGESDTETPLKYLRSKKNRNGRTGLTGIFVHEDSGLVSVKDPSSYLIGDDDMALPGSAKTIINDGGHTMPVEINALCSPAAYGVPQRQFNGVPAARGKLLVARLMVTAKALGLDDMDVFIGTVDNVKVNDTNADLAVVASILSSVMNTSPRGRTAWIGEISLTGQVRGRNDITDRVREAVRLGFDRVVCSKTAMGNIPSALKRKIKVQGVEMLDEVVHLI